MVVGLDVPSRLRLRAAAEVVEVALLPACQRRSQRPAGYLVGRVGGVLQLVPFPVRNVHPLALLSLHVDPDAAGKECPVEAARVRAGIDGGAFGDDERAVGWQITLFDATIGK